jgi:hypothetical protein
MYTLEWEIDTADRNRLRVKYESFAPSIEEKKAV